jgi:hypothetical protein
MDHCGRVRRYAYRHADRDRVALLQAICLMALRKRIIAEYGRSWSDDTLKRKPRRQDPVGVSLNPTMTLP